MEEKYFMHRIKETQDGETSTFVKGIEVHDTLESAILSFHGQMKLGYNNPDAPDVVFVACKITDGSGHIVDKYNETWIKEEGENSIFMHYIRKNGDTYTKDIDVYADFNTAERNFHAQMEYGYGNKKFPNVSFVSCMVTDKSGLVLLDETWNKPVEEPEEEE